MDYKEKKHQVYLSIGSNIGDRVSELNRAIESLGKIFGSVQQSCVYETPPLGFESELHFLNMCVGFKTEWSAVNVLRACQEIELSQGRVRPQHQKGYVSRTLDIDIIYYGRSIIQSDELQVPHPGTYERMFVLEPLSDIAENWIDPREKKTISELKEECNDESVILLYTKKLLTFL